jgi:hypothetical protein
VKYWCPTHLVIIYMLFIFHLFIFSLLDSIYWYLFADGSIWSINLDVTTKSLNTSSKKETLFIPNMNAVVNVSQCIPIYTYSFLRKSSMNASWISACILYFISMAFINLFIIKMTYSYFPILISCTNFPSKVKVTWRENISPMTMCNKQHRKLSQISSVWLNKNKTFLNPRRMQQGLSFSQWPLSYSKQMKWDFMVIALSNLELF